MAVKDVFKITRKTFFHPSAWLGYDELKDRTNFIKDTVTTLITPDEPTRQETFEQAQQRFGLNAEDLQQTIQRFKLFTIVFVSISLLTVFAGFYFLIVHGSFAALLIGFATAGIFLAQAFRYSFWAFQIKHRKLGCTFNEWWQGKLQNNGDQVS